jgi:glycerol-3-phosphate acyltransferase PlsY
MKRFASLVHAREVTPDVIAARLQILHSHALRLAERQAAIAACQAYLDHKISVYAQTDGGKS